MLSILTWAPLVLILPFWETQLQSDTCFPSSIRRRNPASQPRTPEAKSSIAVLSPRLIHKARRNHNFVLPAEVRQCGPKPKAQNGNYLAPKTEASAPCQNSSTPLPSTTGTKPSGQAIVCIAGTEIHLGPYASKESRREYDRLIGEWLAAGRPNTTALKFDAELTVTEQAAAYWRFAKAYYVKRQPPTGTAGTGRRAKRPNTTAASASFSLAPRPKPFCSR